MLNNIFKRKDIDNKAQMIVSTIVASYPTENDTATNEGNKVGNKERNKLTSAISKATVQTVDISKEINLGFIGKARLCKRIQSKLLESGYTSDTAVLIVKNLVVALTSKK